MKKKLTILAATAGLIALPHANAALTVFPPVPGRTASQHYTCRVKESSTAPMQNAFVIETKCLPNTENPDTGYFKDLKDFTASYLPIEFDGTSKPVVEITPTDGTAIKIGEVKIRPAKYVTDGLVSLTVGKNANNIDAVLVTFNQPCNISVFMNNNQERSFGDSFPDAKLYTMSIFASPTYTMPTTNVFNVTANLNDTAGRAKLRKDINDAYLLSSNPTIVFKGGEFYIDQELPLANGKNYYVNGDAIVYGGFKNTNTSKNWKISGSGAISGEKNAWIDVDDTSIPNRQAKADANRTFANPTTGIIAEGITVIDPANHSFNMGNDGSSTNIYRNLKVFGWRKNSDGINPFSNSKVSDCYLRVQDDAFYYGENVQMDNNIVWTDGNGAVIYVATGDTSAPSNTRSWFKNTHVIHSRSKSNSLDGGIAVSMRDTDKAVKNVQIINLTVEDPNPSISPFKFSTNNQNYIHSNILIKNLSMPKIADLRPSILITNSASNKQLLNGITFDNFSYGGKILSSVSDLFPNTTTKIFNTTGTFPNTIPASEFIQFQNTSPPPNGTLPTPWVSTGIDIAPASGSANFTATTPAPTWAITGFGDGINGAGDRFHFVNRPLSGDCTGRVMLTSIQQTGTAGLMIRDGVGINAIYAMVSWSSTEGVTLKYRTATSATHQTLTLPNTTSLPQDIEIKRTGNVFSAKAYIPGPDPQQSVTIPNFGSSTSTVAGFAVSSATNNTNVPFTCTMVGNFTP